MSIGRDCKIVLIKKNNVLLTILRGDPLRQVSTGVACKVVDCGKVRLDSWPRLPAVQFHLYHRNSLRPRGGGAKKGAFGTYLAVGFLLLSGSVDFTHVTAAKEPFMVPSQYAVEPSVKISVHIYNYGRVPRQPLNRAENEASAIFAKAGIDAAWVDCPLTEAQIDQYPACPSQLGADGFVLNLLSESMTRRAKLQDTTFGFARLSSEDEHSYFASVFWGRISQAARGGDISAFQLLGFVMAHEIGHLLLGTTGHAQVGLMSAPWHPTFLEAMARVLPVFTPQECRQMRTETLARIESRKLMAHLVERR